MYSRLILSKSRKVGVCLLTLISLLMAACGESTATIPLAATNGTVVPSTTDSATGSTSVINPWVKLSSLDVEPKALNCNKLGYCFLLTNNSEVFFTQDEGHSWKKFPHSIPAQKNQTFDTITCPDSKTCYVLGREYNNKPPQYLLFVRTVDSGNSWDFGNKLESKYYDSPFLSLSCPDKTTCYGVSTDWIVSTKDSGTTWNATVSNHLTSIECPSEAVCFAVGGYQGTEESKGVFSTTIDGGKSWIDKTFDAKRPLATLNCLDDQTCWVGGWNSEILLTIDGGKSWSAPISLKSNAKDSYVLSSLNCLSKSECYVVGRAGLTIYSTADGWKKWLNYSVEEININRIAVFSCSKKGFCIGISKDGLVLSNTKSKI